MGKVLDINSAWLKPHPFCMGIESDRLHWTSQQSNSRKVDVLKPVSRIPALADGLAAGKALKLTRMGGLHLTSNSGRADASAVDVLRWKLKFPKLVHAARNAVFVNRG